MADTRHLPSRADEFVRAISRRVASQPGDRAGLRRSLGYRPTDITALAAHQFIAPYLAAGTSEATERAFYTVAALIASQPRQARDQPAELAAAGHGAAADPGRGRRRNLGESLAHAVAGKHRSADTAEVRLHLLARQDLDGVHRQLPRLIGQLRGDLIQIDWAQLIGDLSRWGSDPRQVAKEWVQGYHRTAERLKTEHKRQDDRHPAVPESEEQ